jgi:hypothetical protein
MTSRALVASWRKFQRNVMYYVSKQSQNLSEGSEEKHVRIAYSGLQACWSRLPQSVLEHETGMATIIVPGRSACRLQPVSNCHSISLEEVACFGPGNFYYSLQSWYEQLTAATELFIFN